MRLYEFRVGDKVRYTPGEGPADIHSEILHIGDQLVLLRNNSGMEFTRDADSDGFDYWYPTPPKEELLMLGNDLANAIQQAAWDNELTGPTFHMRRAVENWREATRK